MPNTQPPQPNPDPELLRRAQAGDEAAFGIIMRSHYERIFRLVYAIVRHEADARDVCQEIWLTVWRELPRFRGEARFSTWLHPIATRRALDHLRKRRRWFDRFLPFANGDDAVESAPEPSTADDDGSLAESGERRAALHAALAALPPKLRAVLALREVEGLSYEEIAHAVSVPTGTVMSRLYHARRLLAQKLGAKP
ncbi:MAG: sigma-70 family RNA polymerase sigma factor [Opitutae bacterium]|nr:sigma-70 family RNA polymerase sigma factor [Opitutae bacterium]